MAGNGRRPSLSIGLPVYNGAEFVGEALEAMGQQSFRDFELIICDNASTDATESICRARAQRDNRIRYRRNNSNIGPAANFNRVFELSTGAFFKWMAHDDLHEPDFLESCMGELAGDPSAVLAFTRAVTIGPGGAVIRHPWGAPPDLGHERPAARFRAALEPLTEPLPLPIFGVVRSAVLRRTALQCGLPGSDLALIGEIALHGKLVEVGRPLFLQREHPQRAGPQLSQDPYRAAAFWSGIDGASVSYPHWRLLRRHLDSIRRAPLPAAEAGACRRAVWCWAWRERHALSRDWMIARPEASRLAPWSRRLDQAIRRRVWQRKTRRLQRLLLRAIPRHGSAVLADAGQVALERMPRRILPFVERNGTYWGPPADSAEAVAELDRAIVNGATHFVLAWPAFWWLNYYREFATYLYANSVCVADTGIAKVHRLTRQPENPARIATPPPCRQP